MIHSVGMHIEGVKRIIQCVLLHNAAIFFLPWYETNWIELDASVSMGCLPLQVDSICLGHTLAPRNPPLLCANSVMTSKTVFSTIFGSIFDFINEFYKEPIKALQAGQRFFLSGGRGVIGTRS